MKTGVPDSYQVCDRVRILCTVQWYLDITVEYDIIPHQRVKNVVSDSPRLVDFAIRLEIFVLNLPDGQVVFFGEIQITEGL